MCSRSLSDSVNGFTTSPLTSIMACAAISCGDIVAGGAEISNGDAPGAGANGVGEPSGDAVLMLPGSAGNVVTDTMGVGCAACAAESRGDCDTTVPATMTITTAQPINASKDLSIFTARSASADSCGSQPFDRECEKPRAWSQRSATNFARSAQSVWFASINSYVFGSPAVSKSW